MLFYIFFVFILVICVIYFYNYNENKNLFNKINLFNPFNNNKSIDDEFEDENENEFKEKEKEKENIEKKRKKKRDIAEYKNEKEYEEFDKLLKEILRISRDENDTYPFCSVEQAHSPDNLNHPVGKNISKIIKILKDKYSKYFHCHHLAHSSEFNSDNLYLFSWGLECGNCMSLTGTYEAWESKKKTGIKMDVKNENENENEDENEKNKK